jgi:hypothetical protein
VSGTTEGELRRHLDVFLESVSAAAPSTPFLDEAAATRIVGSLTRLIDCWPELSEAQRERLAQTVAYVVDPDDEEHDLLSPIGLVDDEERVAELERELGA